MTATATPVDDLAPSPAPATAPLVASPVRRGSGSHRVIRGRGFSFRVHRRALLVAIAAWSLALLLVVLGAALGDALIAPIDVVRALVGGADAYSQLVVMELRMPRVVTALLVGAALGASGALTQAIARNPLASPDVLGITAGASAAAVGVIAASSVAGASVLAGLPIALAALCGAAIAAAAVVALSWRAGVDGLRLVLVGIAVAAVFSSATSWLLVTAGISDAASATVWLAGSLSLARWDLALLVLGALLLAVPAALALAPTTASLRFGDDAATALGVRVSASKLALVVSAVVLAAAAVAAAGPIAFVALVAPHIAVRLARAAGAPILTSAAIGAILLLLADLIARVVLPVALPVGVVTAVLGGPYLILLLLRRTREGRP